MADNILKGIIKIEAPGVAQATAGVASALSKTEVAFKSTKNAGFAFNQILREAPSFAYSFQTGIIGISNNLPILTDALKRARESGASTGQIFKSLATNLVSLPSLLSIGSLALVAFGDKLFGASEESKRLAEASKKAAESQREIVEGLGKERSLVDQLVVLIKSETSTREQKEAALKRLQQINPQYFGDLRTETGLVSKLDIAYKSYLKSLVARSEVAALTKQLDELSATIVDLERQGATTEIIAPELSRNLQGQLVISKQITKEQAAQTNLNSKYLEALRKRDIVLNQIGQSSSALSDNLDLSVPEVKITPKSVKVDARPALGSIQIELPTVFDILSEDNRSRFRKQLGELENQLQLKLPVSIDLSKPGKIFQSLQAKNAANLAALRKPAEELGKAFSDSFRNAALSGLSAVGEGIGNVFSGKKFGAGLVNVIGDLLSQLGKALLAYGAIKTGLDKILGPGGIAVPGGVALALGVAAIAAGQIFKNFGGARAAGGPVSAGKSYLVGENGPEIFNPGTSGSIIPNHRLGGGTLSQGGMAGKVVFEISGNKLRGILKRADMSALGLE